MGPSRPLLGPAPLLWFPDFRADHLRAGLGVLAGSITNDASRATLRWRAAWRVGGGGARAARGAASGGGGGGAPGLEGTPRHPATDR